MAGRQAGGTTLARNRCSWWMITLSSAMGRDRELQVFDLIGEGLGIRDIDKTLHLSIKTVESH